MKKKNETKRLTGLIRGAQTGDEEKRRPSINCKLFSFSPAATPNAKRQTPITANWQLVTPAQENTRKSNKTHTKHPRNFR